MYLFLPLNLRRSRSDPKDSYSIACIRRIYMFLEKRDALMRRFTRYPNDPIKNQDPLRVLVFK